MSSQYKYEHVHNGDHDKEHVHEDVAIPDANRDLKILMYLIEHNAEHAQEMREMAERLRGTGRTEAACVIEEAVSGFDASNETLRKVERMMR